MKRRKHAIVCAVSWFIVLAGAAILLVDFDENSALQRYLRMTRGLFGMVPLVNKIAHASLLVGNLTLRTATPFAVILAVRSSFALLVPVQTAPRSADLSQDNEAAQIHEPRTNSVNTNIVQPAGHSFRLNPVPSLRKLVELWLTVWLLFGWGLLNMMGPSDMLEQPVGIARRLLRELFGRPFFARDAWEIAAEIIGEVVCLPAMLSLLVCIPFGIVLTIALGVVSLHQSFRQPKDLD